MKLIAFAKYLLLLLMNVHGQWPDPYKKTYGAIWPLPQNIQNSSKIWSIDPKNFKIESDYQCDIITEAIKRYTKRLFPMREKCSLSSKQVNFASFFFIEMRT